MIPFTNLPDRIGLTELRNFTFGHPDAAQDELIKDGMCICTIRPVQEFLQDQKSILIGAKGTGKTAVFELLCEGKLRFSGSDHTRKIILPINEQLDYRTLKERVITDIVPGVQDESLRYRAVWELLILYFVIQRLKALKLPAMPAELEKDIAEFEAAFPIHGAKRKFFEIVFGGKRRIGVKFEASPISGLPTADLYAQIAADENLPAEANRTPSLLRLGKLKQSLNNYLSLAKSTIYILIDRIDEFVIKDQYKTQKLALQGLLGCERSYRPYSHLRVKLFLRQDLFRRIDLREFGADKVIYDSVTLSWTPEDIRDFLSKRVIHNYLRVFGLNQIGFTLKEENLYVDRDSNQPSREMPIGWSEKCVKYLYRLWKKSKRTLKRKILRQKPDPWEGRRTNFNDEVSSQILKTFFPAEVERLDAAAPKKVIPYGEFLATHFDLSTGATTPRLLLMFAQQCVETIVDFHVRNPDIAGTKTFPVLSHAAVSHAYYRFKDQLWNMMAQEGKQWRADIEAFRLVFATLSTVSFDDVREGFAAKSSGELRELLAVLTHLGIIACANSEYPLEHRYYKLPILFREKETALGEEPPIVVGPP